MDLNIDTAAKAYAALGLPLGSSREKIKSSYHKLVSLYHPDANGGEAWEKFYQIRDAYEYLGALSAAEIESLTAPPAEEAPKPVQPAVNNPPRQAKILGNKSAMKSAKLRRRFAADRARAEEKSRRRHAKEKQKQLSDDSHYRQNKEYEEAMMKIRAIRAAEVAANILKNGNVWFMNK